LIPYRAANGRNDLLEPFRWKHTRVDRLPAGWFLGQSGDIKIAIGREHEGARNRRRRHHQRVHAPAFPGELKPLLDAEPMLLVDHCQPEVAEDYAFLHQRMGAKDEWNRAIGKTAEDLLARLAALAPSQKR
jgi:hypothetical protein